MVVSPSGTNHKQMKKVIALALGLSMIAPVAVFANETVVDVTPVTFVRTGGHHHPIVSQASSPVVEQLKAKIAILQQILELQKQIDALS